MAEVVGVVEPSVDAAGAGTGAGAGAGAGFAAEGAGGAGVWRDWLVTCVSRALCGVV